MTQNSPTYKFLLLDNQGVILASEYYYIDPCSKTFIADRNRCQNEFRKKFGKFKNEWGFEYRPIGEARKPRKFGEILGAKGF